LAPLLDLPIEALLLRRFSELLDDFGLVALYIFQSALCGNNYLLSKRCFG